jgi:hypothetical protein
LKDLKYSIQDPGTWGVVEKCINDAILIVDKDRSQGIDGGSAVYYIFEALKKGGFLKGQYYK